MFDSNERGGISAATVSDEGNESVAEDENEELQRVAYFPDVLSLKFRCKIG